MAFLEEKYAELRNEGKQVVAVRQDWSRALGHTTAAWLSQAVYTQSRAGVGRLWFKKILADRDSEGRMIPPQSEAEQSFEFEIGQTRSQQEGCRAKLKALGILNERRAKHSHRRLEYVIDLDRLCELSAQWAGAERDAARSRKQESALLTEETYALESDIPRSSTESIKILRKSSRSGSTAMTHWQTGRSLNGNCAGHQSTSSKRPTVATGGIRCWTDDDREWANSLLERYGAEKIRATVMQIEESGHIPLPSVVAKALSRPMNKTPIEQTSERLSTYDTDENEEACRAVARKNAQGLSASEREQFVTAFVAQHSDNYKTTYNSSTGSFLNLA